MSGCCDSGGGSMLTERDPVCGRVVNRVTALRYEHENGDYFFCGERCRQQFIANPPGVLATAPPPVTAGWFSRAWAKFSKGVGIGQTT